MSFQVSGEVRREGRNCFLLGLTLTSVFGALSVFMLDTKDRYVPALLAGGVLALSTLGLIWFTVSSLRQWIQPAGHSLYRELARFGLSVAEFETQVEEAQRVGAFVFLPEGLYDSAGVRFSPYRDLMWVHQKVVSSSMNGVQVRTTEHLVLYRRDGARHGFNGSGIAIQGLMAILSLRCPWVIQGYSAALEARWMKQRAEFIAEVDARQTAPGQ